ncbi:ATP-dependent RNA helicase HrpA [Tichowtungia aerotolerans]|uniref:ATP-dependent RNA helicase HrpA n=1 Tax=Tichowtungia aerotolerans TaxID=2697043 RepID=A0A6P1M4A7_9BACT|nr:ATP-dependent RNA helicase HrpA [Tichowtungia aerotolerans]QHI69669.1 ATP-dependent RNA helicase HrpA [Tichowtungia aerotolerans]
MNLNRPDHLLAQDRQRLKALLRKIHAREQSGQPTDRLKQTFQTLEKEAAARAEKRAQTSLKISYPEDLPISGKRNEIRKLIETHPVVIVCGTTGSGKTTQLPKIVIDAGLGKSGRIGVTQPRRLAATGMARRVAEEMQTPYGKGVGCQVRFDDQTCDETIVKFMTDGILLAETQNDRHLLQYDCIVIDEAHERSLNIDFLLGYLKTIQSRRPDLKIIISSATLDAESFSAFFDDAPVISVEGRTFPIEDQFLPPRDDEDTADHVARAVRYISEYDDEGDILVFLPGEREIRDAAKKLEGHKLRNTEILQLFGRLSMSEQQRVFKTGGRRRIILSTNVAETSITIPGIHYVIDSGQVRLSRYNPRTQVQRLQVEQVSQAAARQRRGRCGRITDGICIYLYDEETLENSAAFTDPEIRRTSLAGVILQMDLLRLPSIDEFPFIDPPQSSLINEGYKALFDIGAIDEKRRLTPMGRDIASFPVDPHLARMILQAHKEGALNEVLTLVAFLSIQDVRERPAEKADAADLAHKQWADPTSDFITIINLWNFLQNEKASGTSNTRLRRLCQKNFINFRRIQEWINLRRELNQSIKDLGWKYTASENVHADLMHKSLLAGLPANIGVKGETAEFTGARDRHFFIFPGSALFKKPPEWVMTFALVETTRLYARTVAAIDPIWVSQVAPHLCKKVYHRPYWNAEKGFVYAEESIMSGGLRLVDGRRVHFGPVNPPAAREIFIRDAMVPGNLNTRGGWLKLHRQMLESIQEDEEKLRRPGALLDTEAIFRHFDHVLPDNVYSVQTLEQWIRKTRARIAMRREDAVFPQLDELNPNDFPERISFGGQSFPLHYTFEPGDELDGVAVLCPSDKLNLIPEGATDWLVPGRLEEKVAALLRTLPKKLRVRLPSIDQTAKAFSGSFRCSEKPLTEVLSHYLQKNYSMPVDAGDFQPSELPDDLQMKIVETDGEEIVGIHSAISDEHRDQLRRSGAEAVFAKWEHPPKQSWPGGELPQQVTADGPEQTVGYPALYASAAGVGIRVFLSEINARYAHRAGLAALFRIVQADQVKYVEKRLPLNPMLQLTLAAIDEHFSADLVDMSIVEALGDDIRDADTFKKRAAEARGELYDAVAGFAEELEQLLERRQKVIEQLDDLPPDAREDIELQLEYLFRPGFLKTEDLFGRLPRYLRAALTRIERMAHNPTADPGKMAEIEPFQNRLTEMLLASDDLTNAHELTELAMMIEEFRINRFAPEVGTDGKISAKRLEEKFQSLQKHL